MNMKKTLSQMKKSIALLLLCALLACILSSCDVRDGDMEYVPSAEATAQSGSFAPETTAVVSGGLSQILADVDAAAGDEADISEKNVDQPADPTDVQPSDQPAVQDIAADATLAPEAAETTPEPAQEPVGQSAAVSFATPTPQPNTAISGYSRLETTGLGFRFSYPNGWQNVPGRSTVCYVQPTENGTVYPARVSVSMKKLPHKCTDTRLQEQLVSFLKTVMSQYDESTFEVDKNVDTQTSFMGNRKTMATTYLAYDGEQEIEGYVIMTYFEHYVFCYHFVCAYEDFNAFGTAMRHMRDSVEANSSDLAG